MKKSIFIAFLFVFQIISAQDYSFGNVSKEEVKEKKNSIEEDASAAILYLHRESNSEIIPQKGITTTHEYHFRIKFYSEEGLKYGEREIELSEEAKDKITGLKGFIFRLKGNKLEKISAELVEAIVETNDGIITKKISSPKLQKGDVLELKYTVSTGNFFIVPPANLQFEIPVLKAEHFVNIPESFGFRTQMRGNGLFNLEQGTKAKSISFNGQTLPYNDNTYKISDFNIPSLKEEAFVTNMQHYARGVDFELIEMRQPNAPVRKMGDSWETIAKLLNKRVLKNIKDHSYIKKSVSHVVTAEMNEDQKIEAIFSFIKNRIKVVKETKEITTAEKAFAKGEGDKSLVNLNLVNALRASGINAELMFSSTRENGVFEARPYMGAFNHFSVYLPNQKKILDASEKFAKVNELPFEALNWNGFVVKSDDTFEWVSLLTNNISQEVATIRAEITADGVIKGSGRIKKDNMAALISRKKAENKDNDVLKKEFENRFENVNVEAIRVNNIEDINKSLVESVKFVYKADKKSSKIKINPMLFFTPKENALTSENRFIPIDYGTPWLKKYTITIKLPANAEVVKVPENKVMELPEGIGYSALSIKHENNLLVIGVETQIYASLIPAAFYPTMRDFYKEMFEKQTEQIEIKL
ncbi:hypothetical protein [Aureivirga marina]|uniref:hypothetical protein n=1 Tax=Aureivirga marina TaxID=1182451 RepID=UPI0018C91EA4|nr:hypothetical protein [Aureivirga marina]